MFNNTVHYALESTIWGGGEQTAASRMKVLEDDQLHQLKMDSRPEAVEKQMLSGKRLLGAHCYCP